MRKPVKKKTAKPSTSLARRPAPPARRPQAARMPQSLIVHDPQNLLMPELTDNPVVANLGVVELKLSKAEELELATPVIEADVLIKPTGQPYLPHRCYTLWFNRAFGRLGWALVPRSKPLKVAMPGKDGNETGKHLVMVPYELFVHGQPVAFAWGEHEYYESNQEQTYGDVVESTVANALRRCAKHIGVGLELWDRDWLGRWRAAHCLQVKVKSYNKVFNRWRRKIDEPLPYEIGSKTEEDQDRDGVVTGELVAPKLGPPPANIKVDEKGQDPKKVTIEQRKQITRIIKSTGRLEAEVSLWLFKTYGVKKGEDILQKDYQRICDQLKVRGTLPLPGDGAR